ncbi:MAG: tetratricopeptide repeat protein [Weeksellaceae bacterium]|nr:tetratricopeptide repeat protein [Weeksellaceae bacterium]
MEDFQYEDAISRFEKMLQDKTRIYFDLDEYVDIIGQYLDNGDLEFAETALNIAEETYPDADDLLLKRAEYLLEFSEYAKSKAIINQLEAIYADDFEYMMLKARYYSKTNQPQNALAEYSKALNFAVEIDYILHCMGMEYMAMQDFENALECFLRALECDVNDDIAMISCTLCYEELDRIDEGIIFLKKHLEKLPYSEEAWIQLGLLHSLNKDFSAAYDAYYFAHCCNAKSIVALTNLANSCESLGDYNKAISHYEEILELDDSPAYTWLRIGKCYMKMDNTSRALSAYQKAMKEYPELDQVWYEISLVHEKLCNYDEALYFMKRAFDIDSMNVKYCKQLAHLHIHYGKFEEAEENYEKLIKLQPNKVNNWIAYAELLMMLGEYQKAIDLLEKAYKKFSRVELLYQLSACYYLKREDVCGDNTLEKARELNEKMFSAMLKKYPVLKKGVSSVFVSKLKSNGLEGTAEKI